MDSKMDRWIDFKFIDLTFLLVFGSTYPANHPQASLINALAISQKLVTLWLTKFSPGTLVSSHIPKPYKVGGSRLNSHSKLSVGVDGCLSLYVHELATCPGCTLPLPQMLR